MFVEYIFNTIGIEFGQEHWNRRYVGIYGPERMTLYAAIEALTTFELVCPSLWYEVTWIV